MCWFAQHLKHPKSTMQNYFKYHNSQFILWNILISLNQWLQFLVSPLCPLRSFL